MAFIEWIREEPTLEQESLPAFPGVDDQRVAALGLAEAVSETVRLRGDGDQMEMVLHQAESPDSDPVLRGLTAQQGQEKGPVLVGKEDALASIPPLDQMVRATGDNDPGESRHVILSRNEGR
jgi:hypothetical protein